MFSIHRKLFSFEKGSNFQNHSSSGSLNSVKKSPHSKIPLVPPIREGGFTPHPLSLFGRDVFVIKQIYPPKTLLQNNIYVSFVWALLFLILTHCGGGESHIPFTLVNFGISQVVSDDPKESFLVYVLIK